MHGGLHHLHVRSRTYKHLSPYPHPTWWKRKFDHFMYVISIVTPMTLLPQVFHLYTTHDASGLSLFSWVLIAGVKFIWVFYGYIHRSWPIAISSALFAVFDISIIVGIIMFS